MNEITKAPSTSPAQSFGDVMMQILSNKDIPADKLDVVLRHNAENIQRQQLEAFNIAFANMAPDMPKIEKRGKVELITKDGKELGRYNFARWEDIDAVVRPILHRHGFGLSFTTSPSANGPVVTAELTYAGHSKTASINLPPDAGPGRNSLQAVGGSISYGKRYTAIPLLNIVTHEDDDATSLRERKITIEHLDALIKALKETNTDQGHFLGMMVTGITELKDIPDRDYVRLINALNEKKRKVAGRAAS